ncbi:MAG: sugar phosphate isomerase/epimerase family protein [Planctomycetota bacterium]|nr:sugar phosphate isomerase/epimerase family protein [Planctomycetota bacterium]
MKLNRRQAFQTSAIALAAATVEKVSAVTVEDQAKPFGYCFNTSCVRGQQLSLDQQVDLVIKTGYEGIEPWIRDLQAFKDKGGNLNDLGKKLADNNVKVVSAIGFARWIVNDDQERAKGLETAKHDMGLLKEMGGVRIAAPPVGATDIEGFDLFAAAQRYHDLCEVGRNEGITPQLELWGFSKTLSRLGELAFVAAEAGHPDACILPDIYHIYKGGSSFEGLKMLNGQHIHCFHVNDYPADPPRATIADKHRVHVGDGIAPVTKILQMVHQTGCRGMLSLELFNPDYWKQDPMKVASEGLAKVKTAVAKAFG